MKKIIVTIMIVALTVIGSVQPVRAAERNYLETKDLNKETLGILQNAGVRLTEKSVISVRTVLEKSKDGKAISVLNKENGYVREDIIAPIDDNGELAVKNLEQLATSVTSDPVTYNGVKCTLNATAYYYRYYNPADFSDHYIRPQKVTFRYTKKVSCNVTRIEVKYITEGYQYTFPGYTNLNLPEYSHSIIADIPYPSVNTTYTKTKAYKSDRVIYVNGAPLGMGSSMYITLHVYIGGSLEEYYTFTLL